MQNNPLAGLSGFKRFFPVGPESLQEMSIRGIGMREIMPSGFVRRSHGSGDYLFVLFHDIAAAGHTPEPALLKFPDALMIWPPGRGQYYGHPQSRFIHSWIHCQGRRIPQILKRAALPVLTPIAVPDPSHFLQALMDLHAEQVAYLPPDSVILGNIFENGLRHIARSRQRDASPRIPDNLLAVRRLISTVPAQTVSVADLATLAGMAPPHFSATFKRTFGQSPMECLIQHRLHQAAHLLANRNLTISQIASQVGYDDLFHFSRMFKKHFGVSPRGFRERQARRRA